jgi:hypothetical protein
MSSVVPYESKHQIQFPIDTKQLKGNLRIRLLTDIEKLLGRLLII